MAAAHIDPETEQDEAQTTARLFTFAIALLVVAIVGAMLWGLPALTMLALAGTVTVLGFLIAYAAGF